MYIANKAAYTYYKLTSLYCTIREHNHTQYFKSVFFEIRTIHKISLSKLDHVYLLLYIISCPYIRTCVVLMVEFASGKFTGSESSRFIEVLVRVTGGLSSSPITVTVAPSEQSPLSAMGM